MAMSNAFHRVSLEALAALAVCIGLSGLSSCSSTDEAPGGGRVEHPVDLGPKRVTAPSASSPSAASASPLESASPQSSATEAPSEPTISSLDKAIRDDCPTRAWSKNVPKRVCSKHEQCGDGFCDRGRCAAIWTCGFPYGRLCEGDTTCGTPLLCINGRCSSCVSDSECKSYPDNQNPKCVPDPTMPGVVICHGYTPHTMMGTATPWTPPPPPK